MKDVTKKRDAKRYAKEYAKESPITNNNNVTSNLLHHRQENQNESYEVEQNTNKVRQEILEDINREYITYMNTKSNSETKHSSNYLTIRAMVINSCRKKRGELNQYQVWKTYVKIIKMNNPR